MSLPLIRLQKTFPVVLSACCLGLPLSLAGCGSDADAGDKQVQDAIAQGSAKTEPGVTSAPSVPEGYKKAAAVANASPAAKIEALMRLSGAERDRALALSAEADRLDNDLLRLVGATNRQSARIQSNNNLAAGLARLEPTKVTQAIEQQRNAAQGQDKPVWVEHETGPIPALKGLDDQSKQLQDQIGQLEGQQKDLGTQRSKLIADAEQLEKQSDQAQGQQSADLFNQSVDARKQAADLSVQSEALEAKLMPLRQDLERVKADQQAIAKAVQTFGGQIQSTQQNWAKVQEQIAELQKLNQRILNGGGNEPTPPAPTGASAAGAATQPEADASGGSAAAPRPAPATTLAPSIAGKLRQINDLVAQIEARRSEAEQLLTSAIDNTNKAAAAASNLVRDLDSRVRGGTAQRPEAAAWKRLSELNTPLRFKLRQATLQILLADVFRSRASDLAVRANMQQVLAAALQPAKLTVPAEAGGPNVQADAETARQAAVKNYTEAEATLKEIVEGPKSGDVATEAGKAAQLMRLVRLYAQAQADPDVAKNLAATAKSVAAEGDAVQLPPTALPGYIQDALELRTPPTTGPATAPTTATAAPAAGAGAAGGTGTATPPAGPGTPTPAAPGTPPDPAAPAPGGTPDPSAPGGAAQPAPSGAAQPAPAGQ